VYKRKGRVNARDLEDAISSSDREKRIMTRARTSLLRIATAFALLSAMLAVSASSDAARAPAGFVVHASPRPMPPIAFKNGRHDARSLADFRGKIVLLNIWATWCTPCRHEMPTLDRLQAELGGADFEVVALSVDREGRRVVGEFYHELGLWQLNTYVDPSGTAPRELKTMGIPTTLLIGRDGKELGRLLGPAEWDSPAMIAFFRSYVDGSRPPSSPTTTAQNDP
jgi:thiol-disulfide isomerase/thioredoxin